MVVHQLALGGLSGDTSDVPKMALVGVELGDEVGGDVALLTD